MKLSEIKFNEIRIGQVVKFDHSGKYAWVCNLDAECVNKTISDRIYSPRYDELTFVHESGNVSPHVFHMNCDHAEIIDKILDDDERKNWKGIINV